MSSVNKVILVGNLGQDPEVRNLPSGSKVVNLSIATSERWKDRNSGEQREKTEWHRVVIFPEGLVKVAEQYLRKGSKVYLEGQLQTRKWQDQLAPTSSAPRSSCRASTLKWCFWTVRRVAPHRKTAAAMAEAIPSRWL